LIIYIVMSTVGTVTNTNVNVVSGGSSPNFLFLYYEEYVKRDKTQPKVAPHAVFEVCLLTLTTI
jgi:hypothetical protein